MLSDYQISCVSKCWAVSKLYRNVTFCISDSQLLLHVRCFTPNCSLDLGFVWWAFFSVSVQSFLTVFTSSFLFQTRMCRNSHNISNLYIYLHLYYLKKKKKKWSSCSIWAHFLCVSSGSASLVAKCEYSCMSCIGLGHISPSWSEVVFF